MSKLLIISLCFLALVFFWTPAQALNLDNYSGQIAEQAGYRTEVASPTFLDSLIGKIIAYALGFVGIIFLSLIIYSGFQWMTSGGNEEKVSQAKKRIINSTIGLIIVVAAYTISYFIYSSIDRATKSGPEGPYQPGYECVNHSECTTPPDLYCQYSNVFSFCTVCTEDSHCAAGEQCCHALISNWCSPTCN